MADLGLFADPALLQREQMLEEAKMSPQETINYMALKGGKQLGQGIGSLFGVNTQDPMMKRAALIRGLAQKYGVDTAEGLDKIAQGLQQAGDFEAALQIKGKADTLRKEAAALAKTKAETDKANRPNIGTQSERSRNLISQLEIKLSKGQELLPEEAAQARWLIANETKPRVFRDADSGELITIQPLDLNQAAPNLAKFLGKTATTAEAPTTGAPTEVGQTTQVAPGVTVTKTGTGKGLDPSTKAKVADIDANLTKLNSSVSSLSNVGSQIDNLDLGLISNWSRGAAAWAGLPTADRTSFESLQRTALKEANNLLLLAKGAQTEGDAQRARDQIANPDTWKNKDSLKAAFADLKKTHEDTIAALQASRKTLTSKEPPAAPGTTGGYSQAQESLISRWMSANKRSREEVISYLKSQGKL